MFGAPLEAHQRINLGRMYRDRSRSGKDSDCWKNPVQEGARETAQAGSQKNENLLFPLGITPTGKSLTMMVYVFVY